MALVSPRFAHSVRLQSAATNSPVMRHGERGEAVAQLQDALADLGFRLPITTRNGDALPDGIFGHETKTAVADFQSRHGLVRDGVVGRNTLHTLDQQFLHEALYERPCYSGPLSGWATSTSDRKTEK